MSHETCRQGRGCCTTFHVPLGCAKSVQPVTVSPSWARLRARDEPNMARRLDWQRPRPITASRLQPEAVGSAPDEPRRVRAGAGRRPIMRRRDKFILGAVAGAGVAWTARELL